MMTFWSTSQFIFNIYDMFKTSDQIKTNITDFKIFYPQFHFPPLFVTDVTFRDTAWDDSPFVLKNYIEEVKRNKTVSFQKLYSAN